MASIFLLTVSVYNVHAQPNPGAEHFFPASNAYIRYTGRVDFSNALRPRFWAAGVYIGAKFRGSYCDILVGDENLYGNSHNYITVVIDNSPPIRMQTKGKTDTIRAGGNLADTVHTLLLCKDTESGIGYLDFLGLRCEALLPLPAPPSRKIEFIGNSITTGTGMDVADIPCGKGQWYDQHDAYMSYGPRTARALNAEWQLTAVAGIGLIHSCCKMDITMPQVFDKINQRNDSITWQFGHYLPDVVSICLGQNDGIQDSARFCQAYIAFIKTIRSHYPVADIICLSSPMADEKLLVFQKSMIIAVTGFLNSSGDKRIYHFFFSKRYQHGCGGHPDLAEHGLIAAELTDFIRSVMKW